jgi:hypothetical protein
VGTLPHTGVEPATKLRLNAPMPQLTRRRYPERHDCWHVYYGAVHVGTIAVQSGLPRAVAQWAWQCGFYPPWDRGRSTGGMAATFEQARADLETGWAKYLPRCTPADFEENLRQEAWTAWKYAMHDAGLPLPTQLASGRAQCFCGCEIDIAGMSLHVQQAHAMRQVA